MVDGLDPLRPVDELGDVIDAALDDLLRATQARLIAAWEDALHARDGQPDDAALAGLNAVEWHLLHVANIATVAHLARRRMRAHPDEIGEIAQEAAMLTHWFTRLARQPPADMGPVFIPRIGMHPDADDTWTNMLTTMMERRMHEDDGHEAP